MNLKIIFNDMRTIKQQAYHKKRCSYCMGTGLDILNKTKPCPVCSSEQVIINKKDNQHVKNNDHY